MPDGVELVSMEDILTYEEIVRVCEAGVQAGITKVRVTGGEPLVRKGCADLIAMLKKIDGIEKVSLTTNGVLLEQYSDDLKRAGIDSVNISLDTIDAKLYESITGRDESALVISGIKSMIARNIPVKLNAVLMNGVNEEEWASLVMMAKTYPVDVRFIELMPMGEGKDHTGVSNEAVYRKLCNNYPGIQADPAPRGDGPAVYYQVPGFPGRIGFISAIHGKFCASCNRLRLTAEGKLKPCLCYNDDIDIKDILRHGSAEALSKGLQAAAMAKPAGHCFEDSDKMLHSGQMSKIGG